MKTVIQKIILNYFGKFINGINKQNLSVNLFGGNFQLENISLNQEYFNTLNTPFLLTYSSIGKLNLQAPLSKLSSASVQCTLDNIYAVFQFRENIKNQEILSSEKILSDKKEFIQKYVINMYEDYLKKLRQKDQKKQDGIMTRLGKKIIDNLQLKIINVHIRFEENRGNAKYAWGITLEQISFMTTDSQWKPTFIDRSGENNKYDKLLKKMNLKCLYIYWQSGTKLKNQPFICEITDPGQRGKIMSSMIKNPRYFILSITSQVKLIINNNENFEVPLYQLSVQLKPIVFQLQKIQVSQMIDFTQKNISQNEEILKKLSIKKKKNKKQIDLEQKKKLQDIFYQYIQDIINKYQGEKQKNCKNYDQVYQMEILKKICNKIQDEELLIWALKPTRIKVKQIRQKQLKKKKKGWFGGQYQLNQQQTKALQNFVQEVTVNDQKQRPQNCLFFILTIVIQGGKFSFIENKNMQEQQKLQFQIGKISMFIAKSQNDQKFDLNVGVQKINLDLYLPIYQQKNIRRKMNIIKNNQFQVSKKKFISIQFNKRVKLQEKSVIITNIKGEIKQIVVTYKKIFMKKFKQFFSFKNIKSSLKNETIKKWQQIKQKNEQKNLQIEQQNEVLKMFAVQFKIISPLFVCPLNQNDGWCLNLGKLSIKSNIDKQKQQYPIKIQSAYFRYYPDLQLFLNHLNQQQLSNSSIFSLINNIDFQLTYITYLFQKKQFIHCNLPNFQVNFNNNQYKNLISMKDIFKSDESQNNLIQYLKRQRLQIDDNKSYEGGIQKKSGELQKWKTFYGILSGQFIYLYGNQKQLKYSQKICLKNLRLQYNLTDKIISLIHHQDGIIQLSGSQFQKNVIQWKDKIQLQMKSFKTIYQIVQQIIQKDQQIEIQSNKKKDTSIYMNSNLNNQKYKCISFNIQRIGFNYRDQFDKELMVFNLFGFKFQAKEQNKIVIIQIKIQTLSAIDHIHTYSNQDLQTLFSTKGIVVQFHRNRNNSKKKLDIEVYVKDIYVNWKPDVLIILLKLIYSYLLKQIKLRVDDGQQKTIKQLFEQVLNDKKFTFSLREYERNSKNKQVKQKRYNFVQKNKILRELININFKINKTQVLMIHRQTHLVMFKVIANLIQNQIIMGENQKFVSGNVQSLSLYQMTGYPQTNYKQNNQPQPYLILRPRFPNSKNSLIEYKWSSYEPFVLPNIQRINSFLYVTLNPIQGHYIQQIVFRLIDYVLIQVILLLNQPQMLVANQNLLQQLLRCSQISEIQAKQQSQSIVKILFSQYEEVIRKIIDPYFMDMYFQLKQPSIVIKSQKNCGFYHRIDIKSIIFESSDKKNNKRFINCQCPQIMKYIYQQQYDIICNECHLYSVKKGQKQQELFDSVDILLKINKLIMEDQINLIYPELNQYDRSFQTSNKISKVVIKKLTRQEYLLINKLINCNMVYDDNQDQCFIHNFKITKLLSPKPIYYQLLIPEIQLTGKQGTLDSKYSLFTLKLGGFKLLYNRNPDLNSSFKIELIKANLVGYEYSLPMVGQKNIQKFSKQLKQPKKIQLLDFKIKDESCTDITIKMKTSGQKIIEINIQNIQTYLRLHLVQLIFQWCLMEDWVFPTTSIYANDITFHLTIHNMSAWMEEMNQNGAITNPRAFKLVGVFCYKFNRKAGFSQQYLQQQLRNKKIQVTDVNKMPAVSYMTVLLNTQIYHCMVSTNTKRQVVERMTFNMTQKRYNQVANEQLSKIKINTHRKLNLDKGLFKFSFTDIFLMRDILDRVFKQREYIGKLRYLTTPKKQQKIQQIQQTQISNLQNLDVEIQSLSFYLINNCRQTFIPILRLHLNNALLTKCSTTKKDIMKASFDATAFYFNASIFKWQPMVEKVDLSFSRLIYLHDEQNVFLSFETTKPLLINISKQMMIALRDTLNQWNKKIGGNITIQDKMLDTKMKQDPSHPPKKQRNINETVQLVSQYVIRNEIGYPIQIYSNTNKKLLYKIPNLQQIDYEYELQKYDEESQIKIQIGIDIIHNKYQFKKITNISLGNDINFIIQPQINGKNKQQSIKLLPVKSIIRFVTQTKDSKRFLILKTSKWIQNYLKNRLDITILPFDHRQKIILPTQIANSSKQVSLFENTQYHRDRDKYQYIGNDGILKIMGKALVYNYTPIPLQVCDIYLLPDQFVTIYKKLTIQNIDYKQCKGIKIQYDKKKQIYYLYCQGYIIDYANLFYQIQQGKQFSHQFIKQKYKFTIYLLSDTQNKIKVKLQKKFRSSNNIKCSAFIKLAVGNQIFQLQNQHNSLCQYQTYGYLSQYTGNQYKDFKKIIQISPRYILSNTTNYTIKICQIQSCQSFLLQSGERLPFFWENKSKPQQIKIAALKGEEMWGYSGPLSIQHNTHSFVVRNPTKISDYRILSIQIQNTNTINFVHIIDCHPKKGNNIMLCNHIEGITLKFFQKCIFEKDYQMLNPLQYLFIVKSGQQLPFGYEIPLQKHIIQMQMVFNQENYKYKDAIFNAIILEDIQNNLFQKKLAIIFPRENKKRYLLLRLAFEGNVKKLKLMQVQKTSQEIKKGQFLCKIPEIIVSLVGYYSGIRKQIIHAVLNTVQLETAKTNQITEYVFIITKLQIQNCLKQSPIFPIILESTMTNNAQFFIQFMLTKDNINSKLIHYVGVSINKFILAITSEQIQALQENISQITNAFKPEVNGANGTNGNGIEKMRQYQLFKKPNQSSLNSTLYFIQAQIHPLKFNMTFKHVNNWGGRMLKAFASMDNCNLSVSGKKISHFCSKDISQFLSHLRKHYEQGIIKVIIPMIGNLAILGSPLSLAQRIGSGFKDLIQLPSQGFTISPLEGGKGLARGAGSLFKNTFQGALNSVQSVTGSVGNGLSALAFDDEFARERQKIQSDKSQHIGQGLSNGAKSIFNGIAKGITGLVTSPVQGAQQSGIGGFFMGGLKGITGLVVKPVSCIFDATTKTFEGIKNTPSYFQNLGDENLKIKIKRIPRIFYGYNRQFRSYDQNLSLCSKYICQKDQSKFQNLSWYGAYHLIHSSKNKIHPILLGRYVYYIVTHQYLIILNLIDNNILQKYKSQDIYDVLNQGNNQVRVMMLDYKKKKIGYIEFNLKYPTAIKLRTDLKIINNCYNPVYGFNYQLIDNKEELINRPRQSNMDKK